MTLSIQFHAMPDEHLSLISMAIRDPNLWVVGFHEEVQAFNIVDRTGDCLELEDIRALIFTATEPNLDASTPHQFAGINPDALVLEIGGLSDLGLCESWLWSNTRDKDLTRRWREVAKQLKASLLSGAIAVNPTTGESAPMKWHRFTQKAQEAYADGIAMRPVAGNSIIELPNF